MVTRSDAARDILRDDVESWLDASILTRDNTFKFSARHFFRDWPPGGRIVDVHRENIFRSDASINNIIVLT